MSRKLSQKARQHKNEYNAEYARRTGGAAQIKWQKKNNERRKSKMLALWQPQDNDIIEHLNNVPNFCEYVKKLIRSDMALNAQNSGE